MIFDSDIIIWYLRGNVAAAKMLAAAPRREISLITMLELVQGMRDKREMAGLKPALARLDIVIIPLNGWIGQQALDLMERHSLKDGLELADALIAATVLDAEQPFATANERHFKELGLELHVFRP